MRLTLAQAQTLLAEYVDYGCCSTDPRVTQWINLAIERLAPVLNPEKTLARYEFPLAGDDTITLPREIKTVLQAALVYQQCSASSGLCGCNLYQIVQVRNRWYEMIPGGPAGFGPSGFTPCSPNTLMDLGTGWSTIFEPEADDPPMIIRVYADLPQVVSEGAIFVNGLDPDGNPLISYDTLGYHQAMQIPIPNTTQNYTDSPVAVSKIYSITKPVTQGRIKLYAVAPDGSEQEPIGVYAPDETVPDYRRYKIMWCGQIPPASVVLQAKRQFVWTTDPDADLLITNVGALQETLMCIKYSKAGSAQLADYHFNEAIKILNRETVDYDTDKVTQMQMQDYFSGGSIWSLR